MAVASTPPSCLQILYSAQERWRERVAGSEAPEVPHVTACVGPSGELQAPGATLPRHGEAAAAAGATGVTGLSAAPMTLTSAHGITGEQLELVLLSGSSHQLPSPSLPFINGLR